jgi:hypothetical protein
MDEGAFFTPEPWVFIVGDPIHTAHTVSAQTFRASHLRKFDLTRLKSKVCCALTVVHLPMPGSRVVAGSLLGLFHQLQTPRLLRTPVTVGTRLNTTSDAH